MAENEAKTSDEENKTTNTGIDNLKVLENIQVKLTVDRLYKIENWRPFET